MKKTWIALIALPVVAYPAASWYLGKQVQNTLDQQYAQAETLPYIKVVERTYDRGIFSATESVTIEIFGDLMRAMQKTAAENGDAPATPAEPLRLSFHSNIQHGPWINGLSAATIDSELILPEALQAEAGKLLGDQKPLTAHTVIQLDSSGTSTVRVPAFSSALPALDGGEPGQLSWDGFEANVRFSADMAHYTMEGKAPRLSIADGQGVQMTLTGLRLDGDQQRLLADEPMLYGGTQRFAIESIDLSGPELEGKPVALKQVEYTVDMPAQGDFLDMKAKMSAQVFQIGDGNYGPAHYDLSMNHLHVRTVAQLYKAMMGMYADPAILSGEGDPQAALAVLAEPAMALLAHDPEIRIDRLSFNTPQGEARLEAQARLPGITPEEVGNPMMLIAKLDASGALSLPEALMRDMMVERTRSQMQAYDPEATLTDEHLAMVNAQLDAQLEQAAGQGYITRGDGLVKSEFAFRNGALTVNGKPFNPRGQ
jgi:uncharacterized protein YdgA (DUF945 family)